MEYRKLGKSGLNVSLLSLGTGTFGGTTDFFASWGRTGIEEAERLISIAVEHGVNLFDTANVYSLGAAETILGKAIKPYRHQALLSTKAGFAMGEAVNDKGASRYHLLKACEDSLVRLNTDYIDLYLLHGFDNNTPVEETLSALDWLVKDGKVRYIGCSNFAAWQLMKSLSVSEKNHFEKYIVYQGYYSLAGRDYEQELMPMLIDQGLGTMVWSPLAWGRLTGKIRRHPDMEVAQDKAGRVNTPGGLNGAPPVDDAMLFRILDVMEEIAGETGKSLAQIAINWLLQKKTVSTIIVGARTEQQLRDNLSAVEWKLTPDQMLRLDTASERPLLYPHWVGER